MIKCQQIKEYENYFIYPNGSIFNSKKNTFLKPYRDAVGYYSVGLTKNGNTKYFRLHRLLAIYFIKNTYNKKYVNHKDGNKLNYSLDNLEWVTSQENRRHDIDILGHKPYKINPKDNFKKVIRNDGKVYLSITEAAKDIKLSLASISQCLKGRRPTAGGYKFIYG